MRVFGDAPLCREEAEQEGDAAALSHYLRCMEACVTGTGRE
jgi:hypothetical protein